MIDLTTPLEVEQKVVPLDSYFAVLEKPSLENIVIRVDLIKGNFVRVKKHLK